MPPKIDPKPPLSREQEVHRLRELYRDDGVALLGLVERQFQILHHRAQVHLALCGVVMTITGFSGRLIAGTNRLAQVLVIAGLSLTLVSAALVVRHVLPLRWITQQPGEMPGPWLHDCLAYRDLKTQAYRRAIGLLIVGIALYVAAVSVMLLYPEAFQPRPGR